MTHLAQSLLRPVLLRPFLFRLVRTSCSGQHFVVFCVIVCVCVCVCVSVCVYVSVFALPPPAPPHPSLPPPNRPKFRSFSLSRHNYVSFLPSLGGPKSREGVWEADHGSRPACLNSTSWEGARAERRGDGGQRLSHLGARAETSPRRAPLCKNKDPHRSRHACSTRFRNKGLGTSPRRVPRSSGTTGSLATNDRQLRRQAPPNERALDDQQALGKSFHSGVELRTKLSHPHGFSALRRLRGVCSRWWCQRARRATRTEASHQRRPPAFRRQQRFGSARSRVTDHDVRRDSASCLPADPSSHRLQRGTPLLPKIPALRKLHGGGHEDRVEGHTGRSARTREEGD